MKIFRTQDKLARHAKPYFLLNILVTIALSSGLCMNGIANETETTTAQNKTVPSTKKASSTKVEMHEVVGYNTNIKREDFTGLSKPIILKMQQQLESIYKDLPDWKYDYALKHEPLNDGIVGPITLRWLQRFGFNFKIVTEKNYASKLPDNVERIIAFGKTNPRELSMLLSAEFETWNNNQAEAQRKLDFVTRAEGDDKALLALVNRYRPKRNSNSSQNAPVLTLRRDDSAYFFYKLEQQDIDLLEGKDQIVHMLAILKDKPFESREALQVAVTQALGRREYLQKLVWPLILEQDLDFYGYLIA
jgi:hypothetical protein